MNEGAEGLERLSVNAVIDHKWSFGDLTAGFQLISLFVSQATTLRLKVTFAPCSDTMMVTLLA